MFSRMEGPLKPAHLAPGSKIDKPILGYWHMRALGNSIKFLLAYVGEDYELDEYTAADMGRRYFTNKFQLGMSFPNLPFYIDTNGTRLSQSNAIMRYLARKYPQIDAKSDAERIECDQLEHLIRDYRENQMCLCYRTLSGHDECKEKLYMPMLPQHMKVLSDYLGDKTWLIGDRVTYVDFLLYELLVVVEWHAPGVVSKHDNLVKYQERFENLPAIRKYMQSDAFVDTPVYAPFAKWMQPTEEQLKQYRERIGRKVE